MIDKTIADLKRDEGFKPKPYQCTSGVWTIGYGFTSLTVSESNMILSMRVNHINCELLEFGWYRGLNNARKSVIIQMAFQLGFDGLLKFKKMIRAIELNNFNTAAIEMRNSKWFGQTPNRVIRLMNKMQNGR